jgi:hypothetical protein
MYEKITYWRSWGHILDEWINSKLRLDLAWKLLRPFLDSKQLIRIYIADLTGCLNKKLSHFWYEFMNLNGKDFKRSYARWGKDLPSNSDEWTCEWSSESYLWSIQLLSIHDKDNSRSPDRWSPPQTLDPPTKTLPLRVSFILIREMFESHDDLIDEIKKLLCVIQSNCRQFFSSL